MRDANFGHFSDGQTLTTLTSTGEISDHIVDYEEDVVADQMIEGWVNIIIVSRTVSAGGDEGLNIAFLTGDATSLDTARTALGAGFVQCGGITILYNEIVAGREFAIPFRRHVAKKYGGVWYKAENTTFTGSFVVEAYLSNTPVGPGVLQGYQKKPA